MSNQAKLEMHIQTYMQQKQERDVAQEKMDFAKDHILEYMKESGDSVIRLQHDKDTDIKVTLSAGVKSTLNKEALAEMLNVEESAIKKDFLIKSADEGNLSFDDYKKNHLNEFVDRLSIRYSKVEGKK